MIYRDRDFYTQYPVRQCQWHEDKMDGQRNEQRPLLVIGRTHLLIDVGLSRQQDSKCSQQSTICRSFMRRRPKQQWHMAGKRQGILPFYLCILIVKTGTAVQMRFLFCFIFSSCATTRRRTDSNDTAFQWSRNGVSLAEGF